MFPSSVPDLTAQTDIDKEMQLTHDKENNEKIKNKHCVMQNIDKYDKTVHNTSTVLHYSVSDLKTQSGIDQNIQSLNKLIINDNNENIKHTVQNTEIYNRTNTNTQNAPTLALSSSIPDSTTEPDLIGDIIKQCASVKIEHRLWSYCTLNIAMSHGTTHVISDQSDCTSQIDNNNTNILSEQIPKNIEYEPMIINRTHKTLAMPIPAMVTNDTNVIIDSDKLAQIQINHEIASMEQLANLTAQTDMDKKMQLTHDNVNNEKMDGRPCTKQNFRIFDKTTSVTPVTSMLPTSVSNLPMHSDIAKEMQSIFKNICDKEMENRHCTIHNIGMFDKTAHNTRVSSMSSSSISNFTTHLQTVSTDEMQLLVKDINDQEIAQCYSTMQNTKHEERKHKNYMNEETDLDKVSQNHGKMDSNPHSIGTSKFPCTYENCAKSFRDKYDLKRHIKTHTGERPFNCNNCNKSFSRKSTLKVHEQRIHKNDMCINKFRCFYENCAKSFRDKFDLERHIRTHSGERLFNCNNCNKSFSQNHNLKKHIERKHNNYINVTTDLNKVSQNHGKIDTNPHSIGTSKFPCTYENCAKLFRDKYDLKRHIRTHTGERPFNCNNCNKSFSQKYTLKEHEQRIHKNDIRINKFRCSYEDCAKSFRSKSELKIHIRVHTGEQPFKCDYCNKSFGQRGNLKRHIKIHTGDKLFNCEYCNKSFNQNGHLKSHILAHTGDKPYTCTACSMKFAKKDSLKDHVRRKHEN